MFEKLYERFAATEVEAHCDGPCGVYDPSSARVAGEAVLSMTRKIIALDAPSPEDKPAWLAYQNTLTRFIKIKEEQADLAKKELLILWSDYFKPEHLEDTPDLHDMFWKAAKLCSACKVNVSEKNATELMATIEKVHNVFWKSKKSEVSWYTAA